jgi:hypothetical protein
MLIDDNPAPVSLISVHAYGDAAREIHAATAVAARVRKPLFVGEIGAPGPAEKSEKEFRALLSTSRRRGCRWPPCGSTTSRAGMHPGT